MQSIVQLAAKALFSKTFRKFQKSIRAIYFFLCSHSISNNRQLIGWIVTRRFASLTCCTRNFLCKLQNMLRAAAKSRSLLNVFFITSNTTKNQKRNRRLHNMEASQPRVPASAARSRICSCSFSSCVYMQTTQTAFPRVNTIDRDGHLPGLAS